MNKIEEFLISPDTTIEETLKIIDKAAKQIALVIDKNKKLLGTVTDGDIRRGIINNIDLTSPINNIMNKKFFSLDYNTTREELLAAFKKKTIHQIPLLDDDGCVKDLVLWNDLVREEKKENIVVLMVGGLGTRLQPLTNEIPKPLLPIGDKPILERIIEQFKSYGFYKFILCTNYKEEEIIKYFGDGSYFNVDIEYVSEDKRLGTVGALSLINKKFAKPFFVMNGDLLTRLNFDSMLKYHIEDKYIMTIGSRDYTYQIPYGVLQINNQEIIEIIEKPKYSVFVNAGIYILEPELLKMIPYNEYYDMTDLINKLLIEKKSIGAFPIREYWKDIGQYEDYQKANYEYRAKFAETAATKE